MSGKDVAKFIGIIIIAAITVSVVVQVFLDTAPEIISSSEVVNENATGSPLENLSTTGRTVASFISLLYIVLPLAFVGGVGAVLVIVGRKMFKS